MTVGGELHAFSVGGLLAISGTLRPGIVVVDGGMIAEVRLGTDLELSPDITADIVAPGFIDLQVNGGLGVEVDDDPQSYRTLAEWLPSTGVTTWLPTVISSRPGFYPPVFATFEAVQPLTGAQAPGFHLEGPLLSLEKKGAHDPEVIEHATDDLIEVWLESALLQLATVAPERDGGIDRIRRLAGAGVVVSLGHTNASYDIFVNSVDAGATMATHLYNAMSSFGHREPGAIGAALAEDRVTVGLIADGVHSHPAALKIAVRSKGPERIALVSDMVAAAGMPPGEYVLGGRMVTTDGVSVWLPDGPLSGSVLTMDQAVRNLVEWDVCDPAAAIQMATETPARVMGWKDRGHLEEGARADLVLLNESLEVMATLIGGTLAFAGVSG